MIVNRHITVKQVDWLQYKTTIQHIRSTVFIVEQNVPEQEEWDGLDAEALHVIASNADNRAMGTARLLATGQLGRMAVLKEYRRQGVGSALLRAIIELAAKRNMQNLFLHAQTHAIDFYAKHAFSAYGSIFQEAGISHQKMNYIEQLLHNNCHKPEL